MKLDISLDSLKVMAARGGHVLFAHRRLLFFTGSLLVLIVAILSLNFAVNKPSDEEYRSSKESASGSTTFDKATIEKLRQLNDDQQTQTDALPAGRINPFSE